MQCWMDLIIMVHGLSIICFLAEVVLTSNLVALTTVTQKLALAILATATWKPYTTAIVMSGVQEAAVGHGSWLTSVNSSMHAEVNSCDSNNMK